VHNDAVRGAGSWELPRVNEIREEVAMLEVRSTVRRFVAVGLIAVAVPAALGASSASANLNGTTNATNADCKYVNKAAGSIPSNRRSGALMCALNRARQANGVAPAAYQAQLHKASLLHAQRSVSIKWWSLTDGQVSHFDPQTGSNPTSRDLAAGYCNGGNARSYATSEITYAGGGSGATPTAAVNWWLNDPPHRVALLNASQPQAGPAIVPGSPFQANIGSPAGTYVVDFGACTL
jgi:uncharacterized protein YkwD